MIMETIIASMFILVGVISGYYALEQKKSWALGVFITCHFFFLFVQLNLFPPVVATLQGDNTIYDLGVFISDFLNFCVSIVLMWVITGLLIWLLNVKKNRFGRKA